MESFKPILEKIKKIKNQRGYTNEILAEKSGIPLSTLNKILSSVIKDPKIGTIIAITDALDVDINSLIYDKNIHINQQKKSANSLKDLAEIYKLTDNDIAFIQKYMQLSTKDRNNFLSILNILSSQNNASTTPKLDKAEHKLTIEEKRHIVEYELELEEKKQMSLASISSNGL